jgi:hypothetical protein
MNFLSQSPSSRVPRSYVSRRRNVTCVQCNSIKNDDIIQEIDTIHKKAVQIVNSLGSRRKEIEEIRNSTLHVLRSSIHELVTQEIDCIKQLVDEISLDIPTDPVVTVVVEEEGNANAIDGEIFTDTGRDKFV